MARLPRPCELADVLQVARDHTFGWGAPWPERGNLNWSFMGGISGFEPWGVVESDSDWNSLPPDETLRYVLVHDGERWEFRWGQVSAEVFALERAAANKEEPLRAERARATLRDGRGTHRRMFSLGEARRAEKTGHPIKSGYVYAIRPESVQLA